MSNNIYVSILSMYASHPISGIEFTRDAVNIHFADGAKLTALAYGDCCSRSRLYLPDGKNVDTCIGKILKKIDGTRRGGLDDYSEFKTYEAGPDDYYVKKFVHYSFIFVDSAPFNFLLVNTSNGYYNGWLDIQDMVRAPIDTLNPIPIIPPDHKLLTIIVGLPCSGKTTHMQNIKSLKFDDVLNDLVSGEFIETLVRELAKESTSEPAQMITVNDPRFCDPDVFESFIKIVLQYLRSEQISVILFKNNPDQCIKNYQGREDKKDVLEFIKMYKDVYNVDNEVYSRIGTKKIIQVWSN